MKNTMKISGFAGTALFGTAALFKIQHWPLAAVLLTLGAFILIFVFMPSALGVLWKETHNKKKLFLFISAFLAGMCFILGTLFKVQHWPGAGILLSLAALFGLLFFVPALLVSRIRDQENKAKRPVYILGAVSFVCYVAGLLFKIQHWPLASILMVLGVFLLGFIGLPWYTWITWKDENHVNAKFIFIMIGILLIMVPGAMVNLNLQRSFEDGFYQNLAQEQAMSNYLYQNNKSLLIQYRDSSGYPELEQLHLRTIELINYVSNVEVKMVQVSEGEPGNPAISADKIKQTEAGVEIQFRLLSAPFHPAPLNDFLMPNRQVRLLLDAMVNDYIEYVKGLTKSEDLKKYTSVLETANYFPSGAPDRPTSMMSGLHTLEFLKTCILAVEGNVIKSIVNR